MFLASSRSLAGEAELALLQKSFKIMDRHFVCPCLPYVPASWLQGSGTFDGPASNPPSLSCWQRRKTSFSFYSEISKKTKVLFYFKTLKKNCSTTYGIKLMLAFVRVCVCVCVCVCFNSSVVRKWSFKSLTISFSYVVGECNHFCFPTSLTSIISLLSASNSLSPFSCWWLGDYPGCCFRITSKCIWTVEFTYCFPPKSFLAWSSWDGFIGRTIICNPLFQEVERYFPKDESELCPWQIYNITFLPLFFFTFHFHNFPQEWLLSGEIGMF